MKRKNHLLIKRHTILLNLYTAHPILRFMQLKLFSCLLLLFVHDIEYTGTDFYMQKCKPALSHSL